MDRWQLHELIDQGFDALRRGDYVRAVGIGDQLAAAAPDQPVVRAIRAQALLGSDASDEALDEARRAADLAPDDPHAHRLLALAAWRTDRLTLAQASFQRAIELSGRAASMLAEYAWFMASERGPRLAEKAAREAVAADPESSTAWAALGLSAYRLHRRDEAESSLRRALELDPNDLYAQSAMVVWLQEHRQDAKAQALVDLLGEHRGTEDLVASVHEEAKRRQVARMLVERELRADVSEAEVQGPQPMGLKGDAMNELPIRSALRRRMMRFFLLLTVGGLVVALTLACLYFAYKSRAIRERISAATTNLRRCADCPAASVVAVNLIDSRRQPGCLPVRRYISPTASPLHAE